MNARRNPFFLQAQAQPGRHVHRGRRRFAARFPLALAAALLLLAAAAQAAAANTVTVAGAGSGSGTVHWKNASEEGDCTITGGATSGECEPEVGESEPLTTTATAGGGSEFKGWTYVGDPTSNCSGIKNPCNTIFSESGLEGTLTATFDPPPPNVLKVEGAGTGSGTVTTFDGSDWITELNCHITGGVADEVGGGCEGKLTKGELLKPDHVAFTPDPGSEFVECSYAGEGLSECVPLPESNPSLLVFSGTGEEGVLTVTFKAPPPTIVGLVPASGPLGGGNAVRIEGEGLVAVSEVRFGSTPATGLVELSPTELEVTAPPGAPLKEGDPVDVTVTNPGGASEPRKVARYTYLGPPRALTIATVGDGDGDFECSVSDSDLSPGGPFGPCLPTYFGGQSVLVRATPAPGSTFGGWTGCDAVLSLTDCLVDAIDSDTTIAAAFHPAAGPPPALPAALQPFAIDAAGPQAAQSARRAGASRRACLARARGAHDRALRAAKRRKGEARARALRAAAKRRARATRTCNRRFQRQGRALRG